jgi:hypothetical protein
MPSLDPRAIEQDIWFQALLHQRRDYLFDGFAVGQLGHMDNSLSAYSVRDVVTRCCVGLVSLGSRVSWMEALELERVTNLDEDDISACFGEGDGHCLSNAASAPGHQGCSALEGEQGWK